MQKKILIIGATSAIAQATARLLANEKAALFIVGRNALHLKTLADDLSIRSGKLCGQYVMDINALDQHASCFEMARQHMGGLDTLLMAHGTLPNQTACQVDVAPLLDAIHTNGLSTIAFLTLAANQFEQQKQGSIAVITSVAGDRGRASNYVYGAAKALVSTFLQGLRQRLNSTGVTVLDIKPGFVDTPMTTHINKKGFLWAQPDQLALDITRALRKQANKTLYTPWFWWWIMSVVRAVPESVFKKIKL